MARLTFGRHDRLRRERDFQAVYKHGKPFRGPRFMVIAMPNRLGCSRLGLSVGRKVGGAVERNRWKRILREAFRLSKPALPAGLDFICIPHRGQDVGRAKLDDCRRDLERLLGEAAARFGLGGLGVWGEDEKAKGKT